MHIITTEGEIYICGSNHYGELGFDHKEAIPLLTKLPNIGQCTKIIDDTFSDPMFIINDELYKCGNSGLQKIDVPPCINAFCSKYINVYHTIDGKILVEHENNNLDTLDIPLCIDMYRHNDYMLFNTIDGVYDYSFSTYYAKKLNIPKCTSLNINHEYSIFITVEGVYICVINSHYEKVDIPECIDIKSSDHRIVFNTIDGIYISKVKYVDLKLWFSKSIKYDLPECILIGCHVTNIILYTVDGIYVNGGNQYSILGTGNNEKVRKFTKIDLDVTCLAIKINYFNSVLYTTNGIYVCGHNNGDYLGIPAYKVDKFTRIDFDKEIMLEQKRPNKTKSARKI